jgi:GxxExxY protein
MTENEIAKQTVDAAYKIHTALGPGLQESVYEAVMARELGNRGLQTVQQQAFAVKYESMRLEAGYRADLVVADKVIIEIKAIGNGLEE